MKKTIVEDIFQIIHIQLSKISTLFRQPEAGGAESNGV